MQFDRNGLPKVTRFIDESSGNSFFKVTIEGIEYVGRSKSLSEAIRVDNWFYKKQRIAFPKKKGTKLIYEPFVFRSESEPHIFHLGPKAEEDEIAVIKSLSQIEFYLFLRYTHALIDPHKLSILV